MTFTTETIVFESGFSVEVKTAKIIPNVKLELYGESEAVLLLGQNEVLFNWDDQIAAIFEELDTCEPIELLALLSNL